MKVEQMWKEAAAAAEEQLVDSRSQLLQLKCAKAFCVSHLARDKHAALIAVETPLTRSLWHFRPAECGNGEKIPTPEP